MAWGGATDALLLAPSYWMDGGGLKLSDVLSFRVDSEYMHSGLGQEHAALTLLRIPPYFLGGQGKRC